MKSYYPLMIDLSHKSCVVIGGGKVAQRKISSLLESQANVTVISPKVTPNIEELSRKEAITWINRGYYQGDLKGFFLVIIATDNSELNLSIYRAVDHSTQFVNIVDHPELCTFVVPSTFKRGHLQIAITTGGASPGLSKKIRQDLEKRYGVEYDDYTAFLARMRKWILSQNIDQERRRHYFSKLLDDKWIQEVSKYKKTQVEEKFKQMFKKENF
ncbi:hypothetical protein BHF71_03375 [Vulcanibacillus modesticaldus]|uniref:precorrin-2 dehydrogenase n=1 Tax=Vulcanibacillus modesticaldus TaxID=337097 RepID=A0A1D2YST7_9BACI|nr:bifunctional precorrin-2 dehydrogenase/sirohydrochlorin ferrochelatase [Vulcanibacillus modesticaldus]OEF98074.1 hypothetical protein BHF71_03375 [Vulcanibacillus modesticaldus]